MTAEIQEKFNAVHQKTTSILSDFISGNYADTFAKLLVYMGAEKAGETLKNLSEPMKTKVMEAYKNHSSKKATDPDVISAAGYVLKQAGFYGKALSDAVSEGLNGNQLSELSNQTDVLFEQDPLIALSLEQSLFAFENLTTLDDRSIQKLLRETDTIELARALHGTDDKVKNKFFANMSNRAAGMLKEDMEYMGPVRMADVLTARDKIMDTAKRLNDTGEIVIPKNNIFVVP
ncbi:MAG: FliG C-terminal domain-containing protein [Treponema sp.]